MEEAQQQPLMRPSVPPGVKWSFEANASGGGAGGGSFGQDSGYNSNSYHSTTPNNTFNLSSRQGTLATIDEANEADCSMNDSVGSSLGAGGPCAVLSAVLTPKTADSIDRMANFHLTTPENDSRPRRPVRRPRADLRCSLIPTTPERLPLSRSVSFSDSQETPQRHGTPNRSGQLNQLTPHKPKGPPSLKRKQSSFRGKLYSDEEDCMGQQDEGDENRANDLNDSLDCKRLEEISPIPKRHKPNESITNLIRSSTPKTASSRPRFVLATAESIDSAMLAPGGRNGPPRLGRTFRKFQSFSPGKMQSSSSTRLFRERAANPPLGSWLASNERTNKANGEGARLVRQDALVMLELTPKKRSGVGQAQDCISPVKEHRVLAEIHPMPPSNLDGLLNAPIIANVLQQQEPSPPPPPDEQLERAISTVPKFEDYSMTPTKANLIDPELSLDEGSSFASEDMVARRASNFSYGPTLNSILEEEMPRPCPDFSLIDSKPIPPKTPPSSAKSSSSSSSSSLRILKRLSANSLSSGGSLRSPLRQVVRVPASPKALRRQYATRASHQPGMYCGMEKLNILQRLYDRNQDSLRLLLDYLTDEDLVQVVKVSRRWRSIIQLYPKIWKRLQKFLHTDKENRLRRTGHPLLGLGDKADHPAAAGRLSDASSSACAAQGSEGTSIAATPAQPASGDASLPKRRPFKPCNSLDRSLGSSYNSSISSIALYASFGSELGSSLTLSDGSRRSSTASTTASHSPPVSPSKRKFVLNQKVASHLKPSEQLRPCPRCDRPSRIIFARNSTKTGQDKTRSTAIAARLEKSYTLPNPETIAIQQNTPSDKAIDSPDRVRKNLFNSSISASLKPSTSSVRRNSEPKNLLLFHNTDHTVAHGGEERMKLRSSATAKSVSSLTTKANVTICGGGGDVGSGLEPSIHCNSKCDYAICSGQNCGFEFCLKCLCEWHPDKDCPDLAPNSPTREEERERNRPSYVACSRQSRRQLLRGLRK